MDPDQPLRQLRFMMRGRTELRTQLRTTKCPLERVALEAKLDALHMLILTAHRDSDAYAQHVNAAGIGKHFSP